MLEGNHVDLAKIRFWIEIIFIWFKWYLLTLNNLIELLCVILYLKGSPCWKSIHLQTLINDGSQKLLSAAKSCLISVLLEIYKSICFIIYENAASNSLFKFDKKTFCKGHLSSWKNEMAFFHLSGLFTDRNGNKQSRLA